MNMTQYVWQNQQLGEAKMIFSFASQEKNVHPLPGLFGCFYPTRRVFYFDTIVLPGRDFIWIYLQRKRVGNVYTELLARRRADIVCESLHL